jgi:maleylpyruvate isomerase
VRIALNLKHLSYDMVSIHLTKEGGRQRTPEFRAVNPQMRVPALQLSSGEVLTQSLAIIEYLDEIYPDPPLLPADALARAKVRAVAQAIACDIHPLNNLAPLQYLKRQLKHEQPDIDAWYHHWVTVGFEAVETMIAASPYACGAQVTLLDTPLTPSPHSRNHPWPHTSSSASSAGWSAPCLRFRSWRSRSASCRAPT